MRSITPLTITPVGANGDSAPACAPLPTIRIIRNGGTSARWPMAIAIGASSAAVAMLPGPIVDSPSATRKNMIGMMPALPWHKRDRARRQPLERAVDVRHPEEQRHADEREKQLRSGSAPMT